METRIGASLAVMLLVSCAAPRSSRATREGSVETHGGLDCSGQTIKYVEHEPRRGRIAVKVLCEHDRLIVRESSEVLTTICRVHADGAAEVWEGARRSRAMEALEAVRRRVRDDDVQATPEPADAGEPRPAFDPSVAFGGGSCPCRWPDDPRDEHCWDYPCSPPEQSVAEPVAKSEPPGVHHQTLGVSLVACEWVLR